MAAPAPAPAKRAPGAVLGTKRSAVQSAPDPDFDDVEPIRSAGAVAKERRLTREQRARKRDPEAAANGKEPVRIGTGVAGQAAASSVAVAVPAAARNASDTNSESDAPQRRMTQRRPAMPEAKVIAASGWDQAGVRLAVLPNATEDQKLHIFYLDSVDDTAVMAADEVRDMEKHLRQCGYDHVFQDDQQTGHLRLRLDIHNPTPTDHINLCAYAEHAAFKMCEMFRIESKRAYGGHPLRFDTPDWLEAKENVAHHMLRRSHYEWGGGIFAHDEGVGEWFDDNDYGVDPEDTTITYDPEDTDKQFPMYHLRTTPVAFAFVDGARGDNGGGEWARLMAHWSAYMIDALEASAGEPKDNPLGPHQGDERAVGRKLRRDVAPPTDERFRSFLDAVDRLMRQPGRRSVPLLNEKTRELWAKYVVGGG